MGDEAVTPRRRSSLASKKRLSQHAQRISDDRAGAPSDLHDSAHRLSLRSQKRSVVSNIASAHSSAIIKQAEPPLPAICTEDTKGPPVKIRSPFHQTMYSLAISAPLNVFVVLVVIINTIQMIFLTSSYAVCMVGWYLNFLDPIFLGIYSVELALKIYALRSYFFRDPWNAFDVIIVAYCLCDYVLYLAMATYEGFAGAKVLRLLRLLRIIRSLRAVRILRTVRLVAKLQSLMGTVLDSFKTLRTNLIVMIYFMYLFAVVGESFFGDVDHRFGTLPRTMWTLFELLTCDDWFYMSMALEFKARPFAIIYLILYIVILVYIFLSIFIAVLVDNFSLTMAKMKWERKEKARLCKKSEDDKDDLIDDVVTDSDDDYVDTSGDVKTVVDYYSDTATELEQKLLSTHILLLSSLDQQLLMLARHQRILDVMVDTAADVSAEHV